MKEIWKEVPNTGGRYEASNLGNIYDNKLINNKKARPTKGRA